jgi:hypothetical protein
MMVMAIAGIAALAAVRQISPAMRK